MSLSFISSTNVITIQVQDTGRAATCISCICTVYAKFLCSRSGLLPLLSDLTSSCHLLSSVKPSELHTKTVSKPYNKVQSLIRLDS